jgi:hypothetical protein
VQVYDGNKLFADLAKNIDLNHIGNLVLENTNAPISGNERPTSVQVPSMFQTTINYTMSEFATNEIQAIQIQSLNCLALSSHF